MTVKAYTLPPRAKVRLKIKTLSDNPCKNKTEDEIVKVVREAMVHPDQMEELLINMLLTLNAR